MGNLSQKKVVLEKAVKVDEIRVYDSNNHGDEVVCGKGRGKKHMNNEESNGYTFNEAARERFRRSGRPPRYFKRETEKDRLRCLRETGLPDLFFRTSKLQLPLPPPPKPLPPLPPPSLGYYDDDDDDDFEDGILKSLREQLNRLRNPTTSC